MPTHTGMWPYHWEPTATTFSLPDLSSEGGPPSPQLETKTTSTTAQSQRHGDNEIELLQTILELGSMRNRNFDSTDKPTNEAGA